MNVNTSIGLWTVLLVLNITCILGLQETNFYVAVVEYQPSFNITKNVEEYLTIINSIPDDVKLVVFPEGTLTYGSAPSLTTSTELPDEGSGEVICTSEDTRYAYFLRNFSCIAIERNISLVLNLWTREQCNKSTSGTEDPCPDSGYYHYNTNVFFNNQGQIEAYYFKYNLYGEAGITKPASKAVTFKIENFEFGMFTCFDILFPTPTLTLTRQMNISNIIFPTMFYSELPFLTALQLQQMWAIENNATFISSGASNPRVGSGGTGIFLGTQGDLNSTFLPRGGNEVIIGDIALTKIPEHVPDANEIDQIAKDMDNVVLLVDNLQGYQSKVLNLNQSSIDQDLCHNEFCCSFHVELVYDNDVTDANEYTYHLISYSGSRSFGGGFINASVQVCSVIACLNENISSCGTRFENYSNVVWPVTFKSISVQGIFENEDKTIQFPNSLLSSLRSISPLCTTWLKEIENATHVKRTFNLTVNQTRLLTFGIYGRYFDQSPLDNNGSSVNINASGITLMLLCMIIGIELLNKIF